MAKFDFTAAKIDGAFIIEPSVYGDARGFFMETYNKKEFANAGINVDFVQDNHSLSQKNVLRGLHFQTVNPQDKLVRVILGEVYDVAVDLRKDSKTFGQWQGVLLSAANKRQFFIPRGCAHGFAVISDTAEFVYKCSDFYTPEGEGGIIWNDPTLMIDWANFIDIERVILSEKDKKYPTFKEYKSKL